MIGHSRFVCALTTWGLLVVGLAQAQTAAGTAFTYQGQLKQGSNPVTGPADFEFSLWNDPNSVDPNDQIGSTQFATVPVESGLFTTMLDFGSDAFNGNARWLEIHVNGTRLLPRQELTPAPYAQYSAGNWSLSGNSGTVPGTNCLGTTDNQAFEIHVNSERVFRLEPDPIAPRVIGGWNGNAVTDGAIGGTISGGGYADLSGSPAPNLVTDNNGTIGGGCANVVGNDDGTPDNAQSATVGGGYANQAGGPNSTVAGGWFNRATGNRSTIPGGWNNQASADASTVGGGRDNTATGEKSLVCGGASNQAAGYVATVVGGDGNLAAGTRSIAAGHRAKANHDGAFVWADNTNADFTSTGANQFLIRATGGVGIGLNDPNEQLSVAGVIESTTGGFKFPDGTTQTTAAVGGANSWDLAGNSGTDPNNQFLGTTDDTAFEVRVNNERALRIAPAPDPNDAPNLIAGYSGNKVVDNAVGATIGGGGALEDEFYVPGENVVADNYGTVGGGLNNQAGDVDGDPTGGWYATVSGGRQNDATGQYSTVGGGVSNGALAREATVGGGYGNLATGWSATVPGGVWNHASGNGSLAAGYAAWAEHEGAFVWADVTTAGGWPFTSVCANEFAVLCTGGARFASAADPNSVPTAGVQLAAGGGSWSSISDRNAKEYLQTVDARELLARLKRIPITTWNYESQDPSIRHIGPMAQDFYAAFAVGEDDKHITTVDADGVALAAIQGLYDIVQEKDAQIAALEERLSRMEALLARAVRQHEEDN